jgi:hypothetical protein
LYAAKVLSFLSITAMRRGPSSGTSTDLELEPKPTPKPKLKPKPKPKPKPKLKPKPKPIAAPPHSELRPRRNHGNTLDLNVRPPRQVRYADTAPGWRGSGDTTCVSGVDGVEVFVGCDLQSR